MSMQCERRLRAALALGHSLLVSTVALAGASTAERPPNPAYLSAMPAPARVLAEIKGKNPEDTIERQMGAYQALMKLVDDMAWGLEKRYLPTRATPDEIRVKDMYGYAYADLWHKATNKEEHVYDHDRDLLFEMLNKFFTADFRDLYFKSDANAQRSYAAFFERNSGVVFSVGPGPAAATAQPSAQDEAEKLCAAKGLNMVQCRMQGALGSIMEASAAEQASASPGLRMNGFYEAGSFRLRLDDASNAWINCGDVILISEYDIVRRNNQLLLKVANGDTPITLALGADGTTLTGPTAAAIHGRAFQGGSTTVSTPGSSQQVTTTQQRTMTPLEAQQYPNAAQNGQTYTLNETSTSTEYTPGTTTTMAVATPKNASCKIGVLPVQPAQSADAQKAPAGLEDFLAGMIPPAPFIPNGLRMAGTYDGQGGASIEFRSDKAIVACHATLAEHLYTVSASADQILIRLRGAGGPAVLAVGTDSILRADGSTLQINGHRKTGENALGEPTYIASTDTCSYGALAPRAARN